VTTDHKDIIHVEILGQQYPIRSQLDSTYVSELASYVHQKMVAASDRSPAADSARVAVLAALNIADEYFRCRDGKTADDGIAKQRVLDLVEKLDNAIADAEDRRHD
tara:strand:+ start:1553 stop:1870 length:318 start_codon:yes stop_codon:yes gene_type:complete